jgi:hypothetical protein
VASREAQIHIPILKYQVVSIFICHLHLNVDKVNIEPRLFNFYTAFYLTQPVFYHSSPLLNTLHELFNEPVLERQCF